MKGKLKKVIAENFDNLANSEKLTFRERLSISKNITRLIEINNEMEELFNSNYDLGVFFKERNDQKKEDLKRFLHTINPYKFESLVAHLFEKMGYQVELTNKSNDLGVDIIAIGKFGVTSVKEVIQVKRQKSNIHRDTLDKLRGVMPLHNATAGRIVTLSNFSDSCYKLSPENIMLTDGDALIELLFKHQVGFSSISLEVSKINYDFFDKLI